MTTLTRALRPLYRNLMREFDVCLRRHPFAMRRRTRRWALKAALSDLRQPVPDPIFTMDEADMTAAQLREKAEAFRWSATGKAEHRAFTEAQAKASRMYRLAAERDAADVRSAA